jgi:hypothetical protein
VSHHLVNSNTFTLKNLNYFFLNVFKPGPYMFKVKNMNFPALGQSYTRMEKGQMPEFVLYQINMTHSVPEWSSDAGIWMLEHQQRYFLLHL